MSTANVGHIERITQDRVVKLLSDELGYSYTGNLKDRSNSNIDEERLRGYLTGRGYGDALVDGAIDLLVKAANDVTRELYDRNRDVYELLRYGVKVKPAHGEKLQTVELIDWRHPELNEFDVAEEVTVVGHAGATKRPDVVLSVNGIAVAITEFKRSTVSIGEGIRQNLDNQRPEFIEHYFSTIQLVMAGNDTQGLWYGAIHTPEKYYVRWKELGPEANELDRSTRQMCARGRLLELIHDFVAFDTGIKKICRPNQFFGVTAAQQYAQRRDGGIIWHTQGSGKSLTMVWFAKWLKENVSNSRVLIVTDRDELDEQIEGVFLGVGEQIYRTTSGADLIDQLNSQSPWLVCSLVHKFAATAGSSGGAANVKKYLEELRAALPQGFEPKGDLFVFVDECHRSQSNLLHAAMKEILPDATFYGFTGTPLLKADRKRTAEVFGDFIHTYRFDEAVEDGVVVDLRYEARDVNQRVGRPDKVDQWFQVKTKGLNDVARAHLRRKWGTMQQVLSSKGRLECIVEDIVLDMNTRERLMSGRGNALLVATSIYEACVYYELFQGTELAGKVGVVSSYVPTPSDLKGETTGEGETLPAHQYKVYREMIAKLLGVDPDAAIGKAGAYEQEAKRRFVEEPGRLKLLIVVDKLLTGFDAPSATYLYIDKTMRDHGLFQAICRVNRLDGDDKTYGYVVDYKDLFGSLRAAVANYTQGAFDGYDEDDVAGLVKGRAERARKDVEEALERYRALLEAVTPPKGTEECIAYFCDADGASDDEVKAFERRRVSLYTAVGTLLRSVIALAPDYTDAGYTDAEFAAIKAEADSAELLRQEVKLASGDAIDMKRYEPAMRYLLDTYITADPSRKVSDFDDLSFVQMLARKGPDAVEDLPSGIKDSGRAVAETIKNNVRRVIINERPINPRYYDQMSKLLEDLIEQRRQESIEYAEFLRLMAELARKVTDPATSVQYPAAINTAGRRAMFDHLDGDEDLAVAVDAAVIASRQDEWRTNKFKTKKVRQAVAAVIGDREVDVDELVELAKVQDGY